MIEDEKSNYQQSYFTNVWTDDVYAENPTMRIGTALYSLRSTHETQLKATKMYTNCVNPIPNLSIGVA
jgi:hypothetical protein